MIILARRESLFIFCFFSRWQPPRSSSLSVSGYEELVIDDSMMMIGEIKFLIILGLLLCFSIPSLNAESSTCLMVYKEGGAPAVFQSPKCPRWSLPTEDFHRRTENCQSAMLQGRRNHLEDRTVCELDMRVPFLGDSGIKEVTVGIVAVFDGHGGAEASEMASQLLLEYFSLHVYFLRDRIYSTLLERSTEKLLYTGDLNVVFQVLNQDKQNHHAFKLERSNWMLSDVFDGSFHMEILKESLLRAIHDIDATFSKEALRNNLHSGSTATVVLIADGQILAANVGDSKALLCSERFRSSEEIKDALVKLHKQRRSEDVISLVKDYDKFKVVSFEGSKHFSVKELTRDHHPDRDDERSRVEAAGGFVVEWSGVPRVNGQLAVSRAIGDVSFKSYGVTSTPEVTDWQPLSANDSYLVAASDGVFEKMSTQDICDLLWDVHRQGNEKPELFQSCMYSVADCIVKAAFEKGSMDNMAAVVVPLRSTTSPTTLPKGGSDGEGSIDSSGNWPQESYINSANVINSGLVPMENAHRVTSTFNRLLVEGAHERSGCFYLSRNLNDNQDHVFGVQKDGLEDKVYDLPQSLPKGHQNSGPLDLYTDNNLCLHFGMDIEEDKGQCINPEGFARFLGLLESIPFPAVDSNSSDPFEYETPNSRYVLKRRFGRGSYGDVWLAFHWNCSQGDDALNWIHTKGNCSLNNFCLEPHLYNTSSENNSSTHHFHPDPDNDNLFILKRIMVEKGKNVYLSGLREKYFGEVFLNATASLGGQLSSELSSPFFKESQYEVGLKHIARYIESFESRSKEIWLVFRNEGTSLSKLIYTSEEGGKSTDQERGEGVKHVQMLHPSKWWHWLKTTKAGNEEMRNLIWQLLMALKSCHDRNITHRDIKPENMVICLEDEDTGRCLKGSPSGDKPHHIKMRIIDFGSAIDEFTVTHLYGSNGPSRSEQTHEYTAPEALLNTKWFEGPTNITLKYDMWSVGVVMLEMILGSPHVFQIHARTRALLDQHLEGWSEGIKELAYKLRSLMEMCILIPGGSSKHGHDRDTKERSGRPASWTCSEEYFSQQVKSRDPLKLGFPNIWALRLVRQLLLWDPEDRLSVDDALQHAYFQSPSKA